MVGSKKEMDKKEKNSGEIGRNTTPKSPEGDFGIVRLFSIPLQLS